MALVLNMHTVCVQVIQLPIDVGKQTGYHIPLLLELYTDLDRK